MSVWQAGDIVDTRPARRLAATIATVKMVLLSLVIIGTALTLAAVLVNTNGDGSTRLLIGLGALLYGLVAAVSIYVTFGWLEHTLRLLVGIAHNTADTAGLQPAERD